MNRRRLVGITFVIALSMGVVLAQDDVPPGLIFHASFDGTLDATFARGGATATPEGKPEFAPGHLGQGVVVGDLDGSAGVRFPVAGNFDLERGTVSFWVQPVNWEADTSCYRLFFRTWPQEGGQFLIYRYPGAETALSFYLEPPEGAFGKMIAGSSIEGWRPGQWHHIACTWCRFEGMALYVDGELKKHIAQIAGLEGPLKPEMQFGGDWEKKGGRTVIDEAMIFDRMLSPAEIAQLAGRAAGIDDPRPGDIPGVYLAHAFLGQRVLARVWSDCLGEPADAARLSIIPEAGGDAAGTMEMGLTEGMSTLQLSAALPRGPYLARLELLRGGQVVGAEELAFSKETDHTWESAARIGRNDTVLPPFEPLRCEGNALSCYARQYTYAGSGLPATATAQGKPLLAGPVRVVAATADGPLPLTAGTLQVGDATEVQAELSGGLGGDGLDVQTRVVARYDGTLWHTLRFAPRGGLELTGLRIEVPLTPEQAEYLCWIAPGRMKDRWDYGALPDAEGQVWADEFLPSLWIGTEDHGLGWYAESDQHWDIEGREALTIDRRPGETVLAMNIIRAPRTLDGQFTIEFGLQGTPVRPLRPGWRSDQWLPSADISRFFLELRNRPFDTRGLEGQTPRGRVAYLYTHHKFFTNTLIRDPEEFREMISRAQGYGLYTTPYTEARLIPEAFGDVLMHYDEMIVDPPVRATSYGPVCTAGGCHQGLFGDWFVWYVNHMAEEYGSNGIYLDEMWMQGCWEPAHGCGYVGPDGRRRKTYALRAWNESFRRLRQLFHERGEPFWITYHISYGRVPPLPTFGDCLLMAEERYTAVGKNPDYLENTRPDQWRAHCPEAWGIPVVALPQFKMSGEWMKDPELAHKFMAAIVPHDLMVWPAFVETGTVMQIRDALMAFGIGEEDADFIGYWEDDSGVQCPDQRVMVSAYTRPGQVLLCITNSSADEIASVPVTVDLPGVAIGSATDALSGEAVGLDGRTVMVPMPAKHLRLVILR